MKYIFEADTGHLPTAKAQEFVERIEKELSKKLLNKDLALVLPKGVHWVHTLVFPGDPEVIVKIKPNIEKVKVVDL